MKTAKRSKKKISASYMPGFLDGLAAIFGAPVPVEEGKASDRDAMRSDWENIGNDIRNAMGKIALQ